jgi:PAS domain S-box-containing protein
MEERKGRPGSSKRAVAKVSPPAAPRKKKNSQAEKPSLAGDTHYHGLFERLPVGLYRATPAGQIVDVNPAFTHMLGYPDREAVMAINARDLYVDPGNRARLMAVLELEGVVVDFESQLRRRNGTLLWVRAYARAVRDASGMVEYVEGAIVDVTERKLAREEIRRRTAHLEALNAIIASAVASADLGDLLEEAIDETVKALDARMGGIWVGDLHIDRGLPPEIGPLFDRAREIAGLDRSVVVSDWHDSGPVADVLAPIAARLSIRASLSAPLEKDGRIIGGLAVASPQFRTWLPEEITLVEAVGQQLGAAVERLRLFGEAQRRAGLMGQLVALADTLNRPLTVAEVTPAIGEGALNLSRAERAAVFLRQEEGVMTCPWSRGVSSRYIAEVLAHHKDLPSGQLMREGAELERFTLPGGRVIEGKKPFLFSDMHSLPPEALLRALAESEGYRALGNWPLTYEGRVIGLVSCYYNAPRTWSEAEQEVFLAFCLQAAVALQNVHLHEAQAQRTAELEAFYARVTEVMKTEGGKP